MKTVTEVPYRERILWDIAERYHDYVDTLNGPQGIRGDGTGDGTMPKTYTATVREFERLLVVMRNQARQKAFRGHSLGTLRWHVLEYHMKAERRIQLVPVRARRNGKMVDVRNADGTIATQPTIAYIRHPQARESRARDGIAWMAENWKLKSEPMLPDFDKTDTQQLPIAA